MQLNYLQNNGLWADLNFPGFQDSELQQLIQASSVASFGKGKEEVTDKAYRDAYALDPSKFLTSFQLSNSVDVRAELYKLNIYTGPTGCFKSHVDTPRGHNMFGSLVVCLPSQFTGGSLVTRHGGQQVSYDWSSSPESPAKEIRWAAFYSDVEHEILQITEGYRVTLTYNLYSIDVNTTAVSSVDIETSPFYKHLKEGLECPHFMCDGGTLGFACQHSYIFEEFDKRKNISPLLKGSDRVIYWAAKSLGLEVKVKPIMLREQDDDDKGDYDFIKDKFKLLETDFVYGEDGEWGDLCKMSAALLQVPVLFGAILLTVEITHNHLLLLHIMEISPRHKSCTKLLPF